MVVTNITDNSALVEEQKQTTMFNQVEKESQSYVDAQIPPLENKLGSVEETMEDMNADIGVLSRTVGLMDSDVKEVAFGIQNLESQLSNNQINR
ncbi:hypothetical protein FQR65_LT02246 [Abscondita terminalis]|nr:hypothetical protein FQR65_LT02246 [Abscondita terminalis]